MNTPTTPQQTHPHPTPAVRAIIENADGRVLILRRDNTRFGDGEWCLPGGKIDYGQTVEAALAVEIREELSLELVDSRFLFYQNSLPDEPGGPHYINLYFYCTTRGDLVLNNESSAFVWVGWADLNQYRIVFNNQEAICFYFKETRPQKGK